MKEKIGENIPSLITEYFLEFYSSLKYNSVTLRLREQQEV